MKYVFEVGTVNARIVEGSVRLLDKILCIVDPAEAATASAALGLASGMVHFVDKNTREFPAGLVWRARKRLEKRGHEVSVTYTGGTLDISPCDENYCIGITMRDYQVNSVNAVLEHKRGLLWLATNAGKCLPRGSRIQLADGTLKDITEIRVGDHVASVDADGDMRFRSAVVTGCVNNGVKEIYTVRVAGREVRCTGNHPFLTARGVWTNAESLKTGDLVALPGELPFFGNFDPPEHEVRLLAYMLADGGLTSRNTFKFTKMNPVIVDDFKRCVGCFEDSAVSGIVTEGKTYSIINKVLHGRGSSGLGGCKRFLRDNIGETHSRDKTIPEWVYTLTRDKLALFLRCFMSCDGYVGKRSVELGLASRKMMEQVTELLSRFGVTGAVREKDTNLGTKAYVFTSHGAVSIRRFMSEIGSLNPLHACNAERAYKRSSSKHDRLPIQGRDLVKRIPSSRARKLGLPRLKGDDSYVTKAIAQRWAEHDFECAAYADSHITWQPVDGVERSGEAETYDIEVSDYHNFVANGVIVHNTSILATLCGKLVREGKLRVLVIVPTAWLLKQTPDDMKNFLGPDVKIERAGGGKVFATPHVLVGTYQTLVRGVPDSKGRARNPKIQAFIESCGAVLVDEAHKIGCASITAIMQACKNAHYRVGLTGTVDKRDHTIRRENDTKAIYHRWMAEKYTGPVLYKVGNAELVARGISAKPTIYVVNDRAAYGPAVATPRPSFSGRPTNIYQEVFDKAVIGDKRFRRSVALVAAAMLEQGKTPIVFSHSVAYLQRLSVTFAKFNVPCEIADGSTPMAKRVDIVKRFERDQNFVLLSSNVFNEGFSINSIRSVILAGTRKSPVELLQRIGRGLRKKDEDNTVIVVDFDPIHSTLLHRHFCVREAAYREQGFDVNYLGDINTVSSINFGRVSPVVLQSVS